jgi:hypothetical protein
LLYVRHACNHFSARARARKKSIFPQNETRVRFQ